MLGALYKQAYASFLCLPNALRASNRVAHDGLGVKITANRREGLAAPTQGGTRAKNLGPFDTPAFPVGGTPRSGKEQIVKRIHGGTLAAIALCVLLSACASTGTRVTSNSDAYKSMAKSQQGWCSQFGATCGCTVDGQPTTCTLAGACLNAGSCQRATQ